MVTGAASGIGCTLATALAQLGAAVAVADVDIASAQRVADNLNHIGYSAIAVAMDVTCEHSVTNAFATVDKQLGLVDILISNAGIQWIAPLDQLAFEDWQRVLAVHLDGAFLTARAALQRMYQTISIINQYSKAPLNIFSSQTHLSVQAETNQANLQPNHQPNQPKLARGGAIIFIGSVHSHLASALKAPYVTAKHGLLGLSRTLAKEGASRGVYSYVVCPGYVKTPLVDQQIPAQARLLNISEQEVISQVMLKDTVDGEFTSYDDLARTVCFLASFPNAALTGQSITVSHGWSMH